MNIRHKPKYLNTCTHFLLVKGVMVHLLVFSDCCAVRFNISLPCLSGGCLFPGEEGQVYIPTGKGNSQWMLWRGLCEWLWFCTRIKWAISCNINQNRINIHHQNANSTAHSHVKLGIVYSYYEMIHVWQRFILADLAGTQKSPN